MGEVLSDERASYNSLDLMKWVGILQVRIFWEGIFRLGRVGFPWGVWCVGTFQGGIFLEPFYILYMFFCMYVCMYVGR